jgi:MFS family permease
MFPMLNKDLRLIFTCNLIGSSGDGLFAYLLPVYMSKALGASPVEIGILYAVTSLVSAMTLLTAGTLADKYDRKKIMIFGWLAWLPAPLIFSFAANWVQMLPGMIMWGFWLGGPTVTAYVVTSADSSRLTQIFAIISAAWSIGYIYSPALGGYLADMFGMRIVFCLAFILYGLAAFSLLFIKSQRVEGSRETLQKERYPILRLLKTRRLLIVSIFFALLLFSLLMFRPFVPKYLADRYRYGDFEIGLLGSVTFASSAVLGILLGKFADKSKKSYALAVCIMLSSIALVLIMLSGDFTILIFMSFLIGSSYTVWSLMSAIIGPLAPQAYRARWIAVPQTVSVFASFVAPYIGGFLYETWPQYPFVLPILISMPLVALALTRLFEETTDTRLRNS